MTMRRAESHRDNRALGWDDGADRLAQALVTK